MFPLHLLKVRWFLVFAIDNALSGIMLLAFIGLLAFNRPILFANAQNNQAPNVYSLDSHLTADDRRLDDLDHQREARRVEYLARQVMLDTKMSELENKISKDEGYAFGMFGGIMVMQAVGLLVKLIMSFAAYKKEPPPIKSRGERDDAIEDMLYDRQQHREKIRRHLDNGKNEG